jgi:hypothetical protein
MNSAVAIGASRRSISAVIRLAPDGLQESIHLAPQSGALEIGAGQGCLDDRVAG